MVNNQGQQGSFYIESREDPGNEVGYDTTLGLGLAKLRVLITFQNVKQ